MQYVINLCLLSMVVPLLILVFILYANQKSITQDINLAQHHNDDQDQVLHIQQMVVNEIIQKMKIPLYEGKMINLKRKRR